MITLYRPAKIVVAPRLDLELYPYLPRVRVSTTCAGDYMTLLSGKAA